jgi:hypothetical protein
LSRLELARLTQVHLSDTELQELMDDVDEASPHPTPPTIPRTTPPTVASLPIPCRRCPSSRAIRDPCELGAPPHLACAARALSGAAC